MADQKIPSQLKDLAKFVDSFGFSLAVPFDNIRTVGYIGRFDDKGREHIVDDGTCFERLRAVKPRKPHKIALGDFTKQSKFSLKSFVSVFTSVLGIDVGLQNAKSIALRFPEKFLQSSFYTEMEIDEALPRLSDACRKKLTQPGSFLITQTLETDSIEYVVELKKKLDASAQADLTKAIKVKAQELQIKVEVNWESQQQYSIVVSDPDIYLTVGYKSMRLAPVPFAP